MSRRIGVLVNPTSGKGKGRDHAPAVLAGLGARGDEVITIQGRSASDAAAQIADAMAAGLDDLVAVGGDGTVYLALQSVVGTSTKLGIVPLGTGNDAATGFGIPIKDVSAAVNVILDGNAKPFDVGQVTTDDGTRAHFLCVLTTGFDSLVNERANAMTRPSGDARYVVALVAELRRFGALNYRMVLDGSEVRHRAMIVSMGNGTSYGGGMKICPDADLHDGMLDLVRVDEMSRFKLVRLFPSIYPGRHVRRPEVHQQRIKTARIEAPGGVAYADGERVGLLPVDVAALPGAVQVLVPR